MPDARATSEETHDLPLPLPPPYPHQIEGTAFLKNTSERALILADTMGLGKSRQALAALDDRGLVVCPPSLKWNWYDQCRLWRPDLKPIVMKGIGQSGFKWPSTGELVIVGYNQLPEWMGKRRNVKSPPKPEPPPGLTFEQIKTWKPSPEAARAYKQAVKEAERQRKANRKHNKAMEERYNDIVKKGWADGLMLIADEAQMVKNPQSTRSRRFRILSALCDYTRMLTGTPMPRGKPLDLYGILWACVLEDVVFPDYPHFLKISGAVDPTGKTPPMPAFHEALKPYMLRRTKKQVLKDLPPKLFRTIDVDLDPSAVAELEGISPEIIDAVREATTPAELGRIMAMPGFAEFSKTRRQIARARIPGLMKLVELSEENEEPILVFSAHREPVEAFEGREGWAVIHGNTPLAERQQIVRDQAKYKGIAITIKSGGTGLTLTHFSHVIFVDLDWDVTWNDQANDRIHRPGQEAEFCLYTILTSRTAIDRLITEKLATAAFNIKLAIDGDFS
jgi:SNF2 family DNA or RNA helicase